MLEKMLATACALALLLIPVPAFCARGSVAASGSQDVIVVIDPGHGGDDTGAVGPGGVKEKDVVLRVALMAAEDLRSRPGFRVYLTRDTDVFVPLGQRPEIANRLGADLFISIHVNAAQKKDARGVETYFLSFEATDEEALKLAEFENSPVAGGDDTASGDAIGDILTDLIRTASHHDSALLAEALHERVLEFTGREDRGVKQAPFRVLVGASMPAVLVEVGFISNAQEEKGLMSGRDQGRMAVSIADGVAGFTERSAKRKDYIGLSRADQKD